MESTNATMTCPHCGQETDAAEAACPACGHIHQGPMSCANHADRQAAGVCVVCGMAVCDECDHEGTRHHSCPQHRAVPVIEGWAQVYTTSDTLEATLIRDNLQAEGIDAEVLDQKDRSFNVELGDLSPVRILVPAYAYLDAMPLLAAHMDGQGEVAFACPGCGEPFEAGATTCASCGASLPTRSATS